MHRPRVLSALSALFAPFVALASSSTLTACSPPKCAPPYPGVTAEHGATGATPVIDTRLDAGVAATASAGPAAVADEMAKAASTLDRFHAAAAAADEDAYFTLFADGGVFLGTDGTERWTVPQFRAYAHPRFASGKAWSFRSARRDLQVRGDTAWFDEDLETPNLGPARGSGVLVRDAKGDWKVAQYNLSIPIPNERFAEVRKVIAGSSPAPAKSADPAVCAQARAARARSSPAAAALEKQCRAAGGTP
jgi:ketosteroid isomerase-like protein